MSLKKASLIVFLILFIDQVSKIYIKTNFFLNEEVLVFDWFRIHFIENEGMAWGAEIPGAYGKLFLTLFRIVAVAGIVYWLRDSVLKKGSKYLIVAISLILAGAVGNIIDSVFYGVFFNDSFGQVASFFPKEGGYGAFMFGSVVDMLYFPLWQGSFPEWVPFLKGRNFIFFEPVFNIADVAIALGFCVLLFFNNKVFLKKEI